MSTELRRGTAKQVTLTNAEYRVILDILRKHRESHQGFMGNTCPLNTHCAISEFENNAEEVEVGFDDSGAINAIY